MTSLLNRRSADNNNANSRAADFEEDSASIPSMPAQKLGNNVAAEQNLHNKQPPKTEPVAKAANNAPVSESGGFILPGDLDEKDILPNNSVDRVDFFIDHDVPQLAAELVTALNAEAKAEVFGDSAKELIGEFFTHVRYQRTLAGAKALLKVEQALKEAAAQDEVLLGLLIDQLEKHQLTKKQRKDARTAESSLKLLQDHTDYKPVTKKPDISIWYRPEKGTPIQSIKVDAASPSSFMNYLALLCEVQLLPEIVNGPGLKVEMKMLKEMSPVEKLVHVILHLPWPLQNRECFIHFEACDLFEDGKLLVLGKSISEYPGVDIPALASNSKAITLTHAAASMEPQPDGGVKILTIMNVDFHLDFVPAVLINFLSKSFAYYTFKRISKQAADLSGTKHEQRMKDNVKLYNYLGERMKLGKKN